MEYTVLLVSRDDEGYMATVPALPGCRSEGRTKEQALANVRTAIEEMLNRLEVVLVEVKGDGVERESISHPDPWRRLIGQFRDDPKFIPMMRRTYRERNGDYPGGRDLCLPVEEAPEAQVERCAGS